MKGGVEHMNDMREEIIYLSTQLTEQRELTKAFEAKAEFLDIELNYLRSNEPCHDDCVTTLNKTIEDLHVEIITMKRKIIDICS